LIFASMLKAHFFFWLRAHDEISSYRGELCQHSLTRNTLPLITRASSCHSCLPATLSCSTAMVLMQQTLSLLHLHAFYCCSASLHSGALRTLCCSALTLLCSASLVVAPLPKALTAAPTFSCSALALSFADTALCSENCGRER